MERITWLLDPGHGGMIPDGEGNMKYATAPAKMHVHNENLTIYEGVYNRQVIRFVKDIMKTKGMKYIDVVNSEYDIPLLDRITKANTYYGTDKRCAYFSMHGNACENHKATGIEIYTNLGETLSDKYATIILEELKNEFPTERFRTDMTDGDVDQESAFYVLRKTAMPAVLLEMWFFDNLTDALKMNNPEMRRRTAEAIVRAFEKIENTF